MKKSILKLAVFLAVFVLAFFIVGKIMNKDHDNLTMDLGTGIASGGIHDAGWQGI